MHAGTHAPPFFCSKNAILLIMKLKICALSFIISAYAFCSPTQLCHDLAYQTFTFTNQFRAGKKLPLFLWDEKLAHIAFQHSKKMGDGRVPFGHDGFTLRISTLPTMSSAAENVFMCNMRHDQAQSAVDGWIASKGHLKNLMGTYTHCGIGAYQNSKGFYYFTQIFASYR